MRIALDVSPLLGTRAGVGTYVERLATALIARSPEHQYYLYSPHSLAASDSAVFEKFSNTKIVCCPTWLMRTQAWWDRMDVFHGMNYKLRGRGRYGSVVTIHDLALDRIAQPSRKFFGQQSSFRRSRRTALRASRVIAVSQHTAADIAELYGVTVERITVVRNGPGGDFSRVEDRARIDAVKNQYGIHGDDFILVSGGAEPRKNVGRVVEAFGRVSDLRARFKLVVLGGRERGAEALNQAVQHADLASAVVFAGHVPARDLQSLYSSCSLFVFASLYEGFGMPVLEAMACGAPVVCSNTSALPEVVEDAALLVDPTSVDAIANAIIKVVTSEDMRKDLCRRGRIRARSFTWERAAGELLEVYSDLARNTGAADAH
jgi:glycosyltransferase involved in cell wall biosynthesis